LVDAFSYQIGEYPMAFKIADFVKAQREARGNGVSHLHAVPAAVEQMMLTTALGKVTEIEKALEAARDAARAAARRAGVSLSCLFENTAFIARSTGHRWRDEGIEQGKAERDAVFLRVAEAVRNPDPRFAGVAQQLRRMRIGAGCSPTEDRPGDDERISRYLRRGFDGATAVADDPDAIEAEAQARIEAEAKLRAEAILRAAALRDSGGPPLPAPGRKAQRILDAARAAHRRMGDDDQ
jgi:hypothetical protein